MATDLASVRVVARIRPDKSLSESDQAIKVTGPSTVQIRAAETYTFSSVLGPQSSQADAYQTVCGDVPNTTTGDGSNLLQVSAFVTEALNGFNTTVIAYGQTGSGKTHTMMGNEDGIIPRLAKDLFTGLEQLVKTRKAEEGTLNITVRVSFVEIYRERLRDLLNVMSTKPIRIREGINSKVIVEGVEEEFVTSHHELLEVMRRGNGARSVAATKMNEDSSRSHSVFTLKIEQQDQETGDTIESKIQLVDLAGSEQVKRTGAAGDRLEEAKAINLSLSCLGNVVSALVEKKSFVPYRDSKLTRLLQDSLGGTAKTCLIVTLSPSPLDEAESHSTLRFGQRAQRVQNKVTKNVRRSADELERLLAKAEEELILLREQLAGGHPTSNPSQGPQTPPGAPSLPVAYDQDNEELKEQLLQRIEELEFQTEKLQRQLDETLQEKSRVEKQNMKSQLQLSDALLREKRLEVDLDSLKAELAQVRQSRKDDLMTESSQFVDDVTHLTEKCVKYQMLLVERDEEIEFLKTGKVDQVWVVLREAQQKLKELEMSREQMNSELAICRMQLKNRQEHIDALQYSHTRVQKNLLTEIDSLEAKVKDTCEELKRYKLIVDGKKHSKIVSRPVRASQFRGSPPSQVGKSPNSSISFTSPTSSFVSGSSPIKKASVAVAETIEGSADRNNQSFQSNSFESFVEEKKSNAGPNSPVKSANNDEAKEESFASLAQLEEKDSSLLQIVPFKLIDQKTDLVKLKLLPERQFFFPPNDTSVIVGQEWTLDGKGGTDLGFGSAVYPTAIAMSYFLATPNAHLELEGKRVLEIGCGTALVGLTASKCGRASYVLCTDGDAQTVSLAEKNIRRNDVPSESISARQLLWGHIENFEDLDNGTPFEVIIATDVVAYPYWENMPLLLKTFISLRDRYQRKYGGPLVAPGRFEILLGYTPRNIKEKEFFEWLSDEQFKYKRIPKELVHPDFVQDENVQLFSIM
jgi:methylase of polypeptide subunit release factors